MCKHVIPAWTELINANRELVKLKKGEQLIQENTPVNGVYFVQEGSIKVFKKWGDSKESIVRFANKGSVVGHRGFSSTQSIFPVSATAQENSELCFVPIDFFRTVLKGNPDFTYEMLMFYADELQVSEQKADNQVRLSVKGRLAWSILQLEDQMGVGADGFVAITISKTDLASYVGSTYETIYRMMLELEKEQVIQTANKRFKIVNRVRLMEYSLC